MTRCEFWGHYTKLNVSSWPKSEIDPKRKFIESKINDRGPNGSLLSMRLLKY